jgi:glycosyltransferase involved in cell wall biosynthesis
MSWPAFKNRRENPYNWLLFTALQKIGVEVKEFSVQRLLFGPRADILHIHWAPTSRIRGRSRRRVKRTTLELMLLLRAARLRNMKIIWTAHDIGAHDRQIHADLEDSYWKRVSEYLDALISLSSAALDALLNQYPALRSVPAFVTQHGHYRDAYPRNVDRRAARNILGLHAEADVFTFIGQLRPYKNLPALLREFRKLEDPLAVLIIAGMLKLDETRAEFDDLVAADSRVRVFGGFIEDDKMQLYLESADLVVLPYREILNSGSAILALSFDRPVLVPARGSMIELARDVGQGWVLAYEGKLTTKILADGMIAAKSRRNEKASLSHLDWDRIARQTRDVYAEILSTPRGYKHD